MKPLHRLDLVLVLLLLPLTVLAQNTAGISGPFLHELRSSCPDDAAFRAARNALSQNDGTRITQDWSRINSIDGYFSNRLTDQHITDQKSSGRCWMFSGLNILRPAARKSLGADEIEFSQNYMFFYDKLEKANLFLEAVIRLKDRPSTDRYLEFLFKQPVQDGGNWLGFVELVKKYGVVPKDVMPETYSSSNSRHVNQVLAIRLRQYALRIRAVKDGAKIVSVDLTAAPGNTEIASLKMQALKDVYRILCLNFGYPPEKFTWRYQKADKSLSPAKTYTPVEFYREFVGTALDDYYALYSIPTLPFMKKYEIDLDKAVEDRPAMYFVNVPLDLMKKLAVKTLTDNLPVWFGCDVGQEANAENGLLATDVYDLNSLYGMDFRMSRKDLFETYASTPNHNMVFTGVDLVDGTPRKWLVENSWGERSGKKGYLTMTDEWFDKYVQVIVVNKKYIPQEVMTVFGQKADTLPPWDPMYKYEMLMH